MTFDAVARIKEEIHLFLLLLKMSVYNRRASTVNLNQLVTSIPVRRKAVDQVERDKFEWSQVGANKFFRNSFNFSSLQWQSASKAINNTETPAKEKHVRSKTICRGVNSIGSLNELQIFFSAHFEWKVHVYSGR